MTTDAERLSQYVDVWRSAVDDVLALLRDLDDDEFAAPTDLPGWDVRAVAAHLAHLESELSGAEQERVDVPELEHLTAPSALYTEGGVIAREELTNQQIVDELARSTDARHAELRANPPTDGAAIPPITPGGIGWTWEVMLRNRPLDVWMHEQDIRRATGRPGAMNTVAAEHTVAVLVMSFPYSVGKRVAPPAGTTVVLDVTGSSPVHLAVEVGEDGRAAPVATAPDEPTAGLRMDYETFVILGGGRRGPDEVTVEFTGDADLARRVVANLGVTP